MLNYTTIDTISIRMAHFWTFSNFFRVAIKSCQSMRNLSMQN